MERYFYMTIRYACKNGKLTPDSNNKCTDINANCPQKVKDTKNKEKERFFLYQANGKCMCDKCI